MSLDATATTAQRDGSRVLVPTLAGLVVLGCGMAAVGLGSNSLWLDESYTWWFARMDWGAMLASIRLDGVNPPLYYIYSRLLAGSNPGSETLLRLPSLLMHGASILGISWLAHRRGGIAAAAAAGTFIALNPMTVWYAREARPYALAAALAVGALIAFEQLRSDHESATQRVLLTAVVVAAGLITHYFFLVLVGAISLWVLLQFRARPRWFRRWSISLLLAFIPFFVWLAWYLSQPEPSLGIGWIPRPALTDPLLTLWNLASGYGGVPLLATTAFGAATLLLVLASRSGRKLVAVALLPAIAGVWLFSQYRPVYVDRYFLLLLPLLALAIGDGAADLQQRISRRFGQARGKWWLTAAGCAYLLLALSAGSSVHTSAHYAKEDWRGLSAEITRLDLSPATGRVSEPELALPLLRYAPAGWSDAPTLEQAGCSGTCTWVIRQPYTSTHAFGQAVVDPDRPVAPPLPTDCQRTAILFQGSGNQLWEIECGG